MHAEGRFTYTKPEDTTNYKNAAKKRWSDPEFRAKMKTRKWMSLNGDSKMVIAEEQNDKFIENLSALLLSKN